MKPISRHSPAPGTAGPTSTTRHTLLSTALLLAACLLGTACATSQPGAGASEQLVSRPGVYSGYSSRVYDGHEASSFYIPVRDGTRLAVDLFRPTRNGAVATEPLPVVWMHTPYNRRTYGGRPAAETYPGYALRLVPYGYNVAVVDFRGLYASFGGNGAFNRGEWLEAARMDAYDVTEWFATQAWSNGRVGMWGCSATGGSQMQAATTRPPSLEAIFPMSCEFDAYSFAVRGGVGAPSGEATQPPRGNSANRDRSAVPVDGSEGAALLTAAVAEHADNVDNAGYVAYRDSESENLGGVQWWLASSPHTYLDDLRASDIGIYAAANWDEAGTKYGAPFIFSNLEPQAKLIFGPAAHCDWDIVLEQTGFDILIEELRFFDYWLKGIDNGVMDEPAVTYYTYNAPPEDAWRTASTWPLPNERRTEYFLVGNGLELGSGLAIERTTATMVAAPQVTSTAVELPEGGLEFTTAPLAADLEVTGHPVVSLWIATSSPDADVFAVLEDVAPDGTVRSYQMSGQLRASHRALAAAPYETMGLPWHSHRAADANPLIPNLPTELVFDLLPISYIFPAGHQIRLRVHFADPTGVGTGTTTVDLLQGPGVPSRLTLPVIPG
jgi:uncharacterized protein